MPSRRAFNYSERLPGCSGYCCLVLPMSLRAWTRPATLKSQCSDDAAPTSEVPRGALAEYIPGLAPFSFRRGGRPLAADSRAAAENRPEWPDGPFSAPPGRRKNRFKTGEPGRARPGSENHPPRGPRLFSLRRLSLAKRRCRAVRRVHDDTSSGRGRHPQARPHRGARERHSPRPAGSSVCTERGVVRPALCRTAFH